MKLIRFGQIDKKLIPLVIACIFAFFDRMLTTYEGTILFKHIIITNIVVAISKFFIIIPYIIFILRSRNKHIHSGEIEKVSKSIIESYYISIQKKINKGKWLLIFLSSFIFFIQFLIFIYTVSMKTNYWIWDIFFVLILCHFILKIQFYKHHYLSIIIILLIGLIIDLAFQNIQNDIKTDFSMVLLRFLREILLSLHVVINKYIIDKKNGAVYEICFFNGVINLILLIIFSIFDYYFFKKDNFVEYFDNFNFIELLVVFGVMITQLGFYFFALITNKDYTPCHVFIIFVFGQLAFYIDFSTKSTIIFICFIFILFISLIFNEIIELNFFGLSKDVKKNIIIRSESEKLLTLQNYLIDSNDEDSLGEAD